MPNTRTIQSHFTAGELALGISARVDLERYYSGLSIMEQWVPVLQGGMRVRGAFKFAGDTKTDAKLSYLIPFIVSQTVVYVLEVGDLYIRIWKYDANGEPVPVLSGGNPVEVTTTYTVAEVPALAYAQSADVLFLVHPNHAPAQLARLSETSWVLTTVGFNPPPTYEAGVASTTTLYASAASGNGVTLTAGAAFFLPADIGRTVHVTILAGGVRGVSVALIIGYTSATVVTANIIQGTFPLIGSPAGSGTWTLNGSPGATASMRHPDESSLVNIPGVGAGVSVFIYDTTPAQVNGFRAADAGSYLQIFGGTILVQSVVTGSRVDGVVIAPFTSISSPSVGAAGGTWSLEIPTWTAGRGYPSAVTIGEQRVIYAGAAGEPDTIRGTEVGNYYGFQPGTADDLAFAYVVGTAEINILQWLTYWNGLIVGTLAAEFTVQGAGGPLTPKPPIMSPTTLYGSIATRPTRVGNAMLFIERGGRKIREWQFEFVSNTYVADDLTAFANHLTLNSGFTTGAYQKTPYTLQWYLRADGVLCAMAYDKPQKFLAWSRHPLATTAGASTVVSMAVIPNPVKNVDDLWVVVTRTINGATVRYVEVLDWARFLDCSKTYSGVATATITGLSHLEGETVMVRGVGQDGVTRIYPAQAVSGGQVTGLAPTVVSAEVGIAFIATATSMRLAVAVGDAHGQGAVKSFGPGILRTLNTSALKVNTFRYPNGWYAAGTVLALPTAPLSTATADQDTLVPPLGVDTDARMTYIQDLPLGGQILAFSAEAEVVR